MGKYIHPSVYLSERTLAIIGEQSLAILEPGYDAIEQGSFAKSSVEEILKLSQELKKPVAFIFYSHCHGDHVGNLPFYLKRIPNTVKLIGHHSSPVPEGLLRSRLIRKEQIVGVLEPQTMNLDGHEYRILPTPGHSWDRDDICVFLPKLGILEVGDLFQPQGLSYEQAGGISPVPFFYYGDDYRNSLEMLLQLPLQYLVSGHGELCNADQGRQGLKTTQKCLDRMRELSQKLIYEHPTEIPDTICEWIYDTIVYERHWSKELAQKRKQFPTHHSDYETFDRPGIKYFVNKEKELSLRS